LVFFTPAHTFVTPPPPRLEKFYDIFPGVQALYAANLFFSLPTTPPMTDAFRFPPPKSFQGPSGSRRTFSFAGFFCFLNQSPPQTFPRACGLPRLTPKTDFFLLVLFVWPSACIPKGLWKGLIRSPTPLHTFPVCCGPFHFLSPPLLA